MLIQQGNAAKGGARYYVTDSKLVDGFAVVAWPAKYRNSVIMTFIVGRDGTIYKRDFGAHTSEMVAVLGVYNPDGGWTAARTLESHKALVDSQSPELAPKSHEEPVDSQSPKP